MDWQFEDLFSEEETRDEEGNVTDYGLDKTQEAVEAELLPTI